jgi:hypothetical protein
LRGKQKPEVMQKLEKYYPSWKVNQTTWCYSPEGSTLHDHHCENLKSYIQKLDDGTSAKNIAVTYGISETTVTDIWKNTYNLINFSRSSNLTSGLSKKKVTKRSIYEDLDKAEI